MEAIATIVASLIAAIIGGVVVEYIRNRNAREAEMERIKNTSLQELKSKSYAEVLGNLGETIGDADYVLRNNAMFFLFASDDVIRQVIQIRQAEAERWRGKDEDEQPSAKPDIVNRLVNFAGSSQATKWGETALALRKDIGHIDTKLTADDFVRLTEPLLRESRRSE